MRILLLLALSCAAALGQWGGELRVSLRSEPKTLHPALANDDASETVRYLTGGVLIRVNRLSQVLEPALATSWKVLQHGEAIRFELRRGVSFSDGTPFTADDVAYTMEVLMDPNLHSPTGDAFRAGSGAVRTRVESPYSVTITFPEPLADLPRLFDQVAVLSRRSSLKERAVLGPFRVAEQKAGAYLVLSRNPHYWKSEGRRRLPYLDAVRLDVQQNRETELLRFRRGQIDLISILDPDQYEQLASENKGWVRDAGPTLENEFLWFNQVALAPLPAYKKAWFRSQKFRLAISHAIRRDDLCRVAFRGHARPGIGPFPAANQFWFNRSLTPHAFDLKLARRLLAEAGFRSAKNSLTDAQGNAVEFSLITNAGNKARERMAAMIQQDLAALGVRLNVVPLDFNSLLERISKTSQYESCLLGFNNVDLDPNGQMSLWLSSSANHAWNPRQKMPETPWEAMIDQLMRTQASSADPKRRKAAFDRVQQIAWEQAPLLYLVNRNALVAVSPAVRNVRPSILTPRLLWNIERIAVERTK